MMPYGVINIGMWYAKGNPCRPELPNHKQGRQGDVFLNDDPDVKALIKKSKDENLSKCSLKDIGLINPTPLIKATTFGDNSYDVPVTTEDGPVATTTTKHNIVIDDPTEPTNGKTTTRNPSDKTTTTGTGSTRPIPPLPPRPHPLLLLPPRVRTEHGVHNLRHGTHTSAGATKPADNTDTDNMGGFPVAGIVAIVIAAVLVLAWRCCISSPEPVR